MSTQPIVVTAPVMFVQTVAKEISDQLCQTLATHRVVIVDLTETLVCDLAALGELSTAHELATAGDRELRLVVSSASIMRQFALAGLDATMLIYPSLILATVPGPATSAGRLTWVDR